MTKPPPAPDWNDLSPFLAVARTGSFAAAARSLGLQHSTVSRRVCALERTLGSRLFHRMPTGTALTETGQRLLPLAVKAEAALAALSAAVTGQTRALRLSVPTGFAPLLAPDLIAFHGSNPHLSVEVLATSQPSDIVAGVADIALRLAPSMDAALVIRRVAEVGLTLYASPAYLRTHPVTRPFSFAGHNLIGLHPDLALTPGAAWLDAHAGAATVVMRLAQMAEVCATAAGGAGLALLPCILADAADDLVRVIPDVLVRQPLTLVCRRDVADDPASRRVITMLTRAITARKTALLGVA
jgi:DNA-binding transcriptional LysR family regulator